MRLKIFQEAAMPLAGHKPPMDEEATLAARAAWLYFAGGRTQGEVAEELNVASTKAHRLIAKATRDGLIRVFVEGPMAGCITLEDELKRRFGLTHCEVVPNVDDGPLPLRTLGTAGARYIRHALDRGQDKVIALGHGRTLAASIDFMPSVSSPGVKFVSLLGGLTRRFSANPFDVIQRLAEKTGAEGYLLPVPFFANSISDKKVLLNQLGIGDVLELADAASLLVVGIGEASANGFLHVAGMVGAEEIEAVKSAGAVGELLGHFFALDGCHIPNGLSDRALAPDLKRLRGRRIAAIAGGTTKVPAIRSILASELLHGLITDETTAIELVATTSEQDAANKDRRTG
jgi:DNA-binding transcriptional regulator LsrR (DeoR family)